MKRVYAFLASLVCLGLVVIWWHGFSQFVELTMDTPLATSVFGWTATLYYSLTITLLVIAALGCLYYALREDRQDGLSHAEPNDAD